MRPCRRIGWEQALVSASWRSHEAKSGHGDAPGPWSGPGAVMTVAAVIRTAYSALRRGREWPGGPGGWGSQSAPGQRSGQRGVAVGEGRDCGHDVPQPVLAGVGGHVVGAEA